MTLQDLANIATIIGALAVPLSGAFIWLQLAQQTRIARAENTAKIIELIQGMNLQTIDNKETAELWVRGPDDYRSFDQVQLHRYRCILFDWLNIHETIYIQAQEGLIGDQTFAAWTRDLQKFIAHHHLKDKWADVSFAYSDAFQKHVESLL